MPTHNPMTPEEIIAWYKEWLDEDDSVIPTSQDFLRHALASYAAHLAGRMPKGYSCNHDGCTLGCVDGERLQAKNDVLDDVRAVFDSEIGKLSN